MEYIHMLDPNIRRSSNDNIFRNALLKFIRPVEKKISNINMILTTHLEKKR